MSDFSEKKVLAPAGHPIHILMEEHKILLAFADELKNISQKAQSKDKASAREIAGELKKIQDKLRSSASHYLREENVLFPYLERHGITQPPAMMWMEHDKIREIEKNLYKFIDSCGRMDSDSFKKNLKDLSSVLAETLSSHYYKENNILFPTSLKVITDNEWKDIKKEFDEVGYCSFTPESAISGLKERTSRPAARPEVEGLVTFRTGNLSHEEIEAVFNSLPFDLTFVDKEDIVRYFSQTKERIFTRTKAVIGRKVQQCHPQKSLNIVNQILEDFKSGRRDVADFWIHLDGRLVYIRYLPVRSKKGEYLGCLEVTQDITNLKSISGEKKLLS